MYWNYYAYHATFSRAPGYLKIDMVEIVGVALFEAQDRSFHFQKKDVFTDLDKIAQACGGIAAVWTEIVFLFVEHKMLQLVDVPS